MTHTYYPPSVGPAPTGTTTSFKTGNIPVSPAEMWKLHHGGYARNYEVYGSITYTISWTAGQTIGNGITL